VKATAPLLVGLRARLVQSLQPFMDGRPYALVDFPDYANIGDVAIWCATRATLTQLAGRPPAYCATLDAADPAACRRALGPSGGRVFILGGGNFGDLYPKHHGNRLALIKALSRLPIIQLPQSLHFEASSTSLHETTRRVLDAHGDVTLMAREAPSLTLARALVGPDRALLVPDLAHMLEAPKLPAPAQPIVRLLRRDSETTQARGGADAGTDWRADRKVRRLNRLRHMLAFLPASPRQSLRERVAQAKLLRGWEILAGGRVVITDRLHGHILALGLGAPQVLLDSSTGKVFAYHEAWSGQAPFIARAASREQAETLAHRFVIDDPIAS
jgi:pyruvyl transferase EpsO